MEIDHIFIFSKNNGQEADGLAEFGFAEGSGQIHPGQGTVNRKFYFQNFFLEIIWVADEGELKNGGLANMGFLERTRYVENNCSPFGLCLVNSEESDGLFTDPLIYQPKYFPDGMPIEIFPHGKNIHFPWTFRLPIKRGETHEPVSHENGIRLLTKAIFGIPENNFQNEFTDFFEDISNIEFSDGKTISLTLEFDNLEKGKSHFSPDLNLIIKY